MHEKVKNNKVKVVDDYGEQEVKMEKTKMLLVSDDEFYSDRFLDCARRKKENISIDCMSYEEFVNQYKNHVMMEKYKIALLDMYSFRKCQYDFIDDLKNINEKDNFSPFLIKLVKDTLSSDARSICRYTSITELIAKAIQSYGKSTGEYLPAFITRDENCRIFSIISSEGGSGCTSIAISLCRELSIGQEDSVLYVSLSQHHEERMLFQCNRRNNVREYIYHMFYGDINHCSSMEAYLNRDDYGVWAFNASTYKNRILDLKLFQFEQLLKHIAEHRIFSAIVFDIGSNLDEISQYAVAVSDRVLYVIDKKVDLMKEHMKFMSVDEEKSLICKNKEKILTKVDEFFADEVVEVKEETDFQFKIPMDEESFSNFHGAANIKMGGEFTNCISQLAEALKKY